MFVDFENIGPAHLDFTVYIKRDDPSSVQRALLSRSKFEPGSLSFCYAAYGEKGSILVHGNETSQYFTLRETPK